MIRFMFFNPEDVEYFKAADLHTKLGLTGRILASVGTHGALKATFNAPISQADSVCIHLYKRVYPRWGDCYAPLVGGRGGGGGGGAGGGSGSAGGGAW